MNFWCKEVFDLDVDLHSAYNAHWKSYCIDLENVEFYIIIHI